MPITASQARRFVKEASFARGRRLSLARKCFVESAVEISAQMPDAWDITAWAPTRCSAEIVVRRCGKPVIEVRMNSGIFVSPKMAGLTAMQQERCLQMLEDALHLWQAEVAGLPEATEDAKLPKAPAALLAELNMLTFGYRQPSDKKSV